MFLADLFIHGIGGGKYDEVTDEIIRRFYRLEPPGYMVLSGTLLLPLSTYAVKPQDHGRLIQAIRDLYYNPQSHLDDSPDDEIRRRAAQKLALIARQPATPQQRCERFQALRALNDRIRPVVAERIDRLREQLVQCDHELQGNAVLNRRDYAFCMYPERKLREFCTPFLTTAKPAVP